MNRILFYLALAGVALTFQTVLLPLFLPNSYKPDLILLLVIYLGLHEKLWSGGLLVYSIGRGCDVFAGSFPGLHGFVLLAIFLAVRAIVSRVNAESSALLLGLVFLGTVLQGALTVFALEFFLVDAQFWPQILWALPPQILINLVAAFLLLKVALWFQLRFLPRRGMPGLRKVDSRYGT